MRKLIAASIMVLLLSGCCKTGATGDCNPRPTPSGSYPLQHGEQ